MKYEPVLTYVERGSEIAVVPTVLVYVGRRDDWTPYCVAVCLRWLVWSLHVDVYPRRWNAHVIKRMTTEV